jgi:hypothetical protein
VNAGDNITTGSSNIIIGSGVDAPSATGSNQLNIGNWIKKDGVNPVLRVSDATLQLSGTARTYHTSGYMTDSSAYTFDIPVMNESGQGNVFFVTAGYAHTSSTAYSCAHVGMYAARGTAISSIGTLLNQTSANAGSWSVSKTSATNLRITKNAGSYAGAGYGFVKVVFHTV